MRCAVPALSRAGLAFLAAPAARRPSLVPVNPFAPLVPLLRFHRQCGDRPGDEPFQTDRLSRLLAVAVGALFDPPQSRINLADELALAITGAQLDRAVRLRRSPVGVIGVIVAFR